MASDMVCDIANELEEIEVTESDAALLRELLEELEKEERMINKDENEEKCHVESSVDADVNMVAAETDQQPEYSSGIDDSGWMDLVEAGSMLQSTNDIAVSDWYGCENTVGILGFEHCNDVGDFYSYMYNDMTYNGLWED